MADSDWPESSGHTRQRAGAVLTALRALDEAVVRRRPTGVFEAVVEDTRRTFRGAAEVDFWRSRRRMPSTQELDQYCEHILGLVRSF